MQYLVDLDFYGSVSPYSTKTMESFGTIMGKKVFQETRKALKVRRTAVGALLVDMPEHICFRVSFFLWNTNRNQSLAKEKYYYQREIYNYSST